MKVISLFIGFFFINSLYSEVILENRAESLKNYPCMECHVNIKSKTVKWPLTTPHHLMNFKHMNSIKNCFQCHDQKDRNLLILPDGKKVGYKDSYQLCASCHGEKKRDWEKGIHGKQVGSWNGKKYRLSCTHCHDAHSPAFPLMKADEGPVHPNKNKQNHKGGH